jgi:hypothetical protein
MIGPVINPSALAAVRAEEEQSRRNRTLLIVGAIAVWFFFLRK